MPKNPRPSVARVDAQLLAQLRAVRDLGRLCIWVEGRAPRRGGCLTDCQELHIKSVFNRYQMCVYMYMCTYTYTYIYPHTYICMYVSMHVCMSVCIYLYMYVYIYINVSIYVMSDNLATTASCFSLPCVERR